MKPLFLASTLIPFLATACIAQQKAPATDLVPIVAPNAIPAAAAPDKPLQMVDTLAWRSKNWSLRPVLTLDDLPGFAVAPVDAGIGRFGGLKSQVMTKTGFFHAEKAADGRWWMVDPDGYGFINRGVNSVNRSDSPAVEAVRKDKFGGPIGWATQTVQLLRENGFNSTANWSDDEILMQAPNRLPYAHRWNFIAGYKNERPFKSKVKGKKTAYPADALPVFDPEFVTYCDENAKQLEPWKNDPYLIGHFSDNELPFYENTLDNFLTLEPADPGHKAAMEWLRKKHGANASAKTITDDDRAEFLALVADKYFSIVSAAIKKHDPNHMFIGSRFHAHVMDYPLLMQKAGQYLDVVSINYYGHWEPSQERMDDWAKSSGRPFLVSEFYAKGADTGMPNTSGAGWTVRTQHDRGLFYEQFAIGLLKNRNCVGWHWFKYADNDPANPGDESNTDSNKGIVDISYQPYQPLLNVMQTMNERVYRVANYFDQRAHASKTATAK